MQYCAVDVNWVRESWYIAAVAMLIAAGHVHAFQTPANGSEQEEQARPRLAVLDFRPGEQISGSDATALADAVRDECQRSVIFELMDRQMMKERMDEKDWASTGECDQVKCLIRFGKSLDAQKILGGFATKLGDDWVLTIRLVDVNTGRQEKHFSRRHSGSKQDLFDLARAGTRELLRLEPVHPESKPEGYRPPAKTLVLDLAHGVKMDLVLVEAGEFQMGASNGNSDERKGHTVQLTRPFFLGKTEVTRAQWEAMMGDNPPDAEAYDMPVTPVAWKDAMEFCRKLSLKARREIRLPTEAEWEYACRSGSTSQWCFGDHEYELLDYAWYAENSDGKAHPVGGKYPNSWGLYDMHGNVWEWCADWYGGYRYPPRKEVDPIGPTGGPGHVLRGGSWTSGPSELRSAARHKHGAGDDLRHGIDGRDLPRGFRVAASVAP